MAAKKKPGVSRVVKKSAPAAKPATAAAKYLMFGEYSKEHGGVFAGSFPGEKGQPPVWLFVPKDKKALAFKGAWGPAQKVAGADSQTDGMANTKAMAAAGSEIAKHARALKVEGHTDWYIAARREARAIAALAPEAFGAKGWRWTSTQFRDWADNAWLQDFDDGFQSSTRKSISYEVAFVRRVPIQ